ncbi:MAG: hypothetical protein OEZ16_02185 [Chromatiales bacterium]|nr:hypothetical protein [Chromatiales bacterium]
MRPLLLLSLLLLPPAALAQLNFITLHHRNAEQLLPLLQPVVDEGIRLSGQGPTLIVNSRPEQLAEIQQLVAQLDTPLRSLLITVSQGDGEATTGLSGDIHDELQRPTIHIAATAKKSRESVRQQIRVIEGEWALISAGESVPFVTQTTTQSHRGVTTQKSVDYRDLQSGFEVRPRLSGERVTLEVRPFRAKRSDDNSAVIEQQTIDTTVSGTLGEWIEIGGVSEDRSHDRLGTVYATGKQQTTTRNVKLKVEPLPN